MHPIQFGSPKETRITLFGETWITNLNPYLELAQNIKHKMNKMSTGSRYTKDKPPPAKKQKLEKPAPTSTVTSGYVQTLNKVTLDSGVNTRINVTLQQLGLAWHEIPITFSNLNDVKYVGGRVANFYKNWERLTTHDEILNIAKGGDINFSTPPNTQGPPMNKGYMHHTRPSNEMAAIMKLLDNRVIEPAKTVGITSNIFFKKKASGELRCILDLSQVNVSVEYQHFKMSSIKEAILLTLPNDLYIIIDLSTAYDCVLIAIKSRKYLQFNVGHTVYQYRGFPNELAEAPRKFTKLLKPLCGLLTFLGIRFVTYIDDMLVMHQDRETLLKQASWICQAFMYLGFIINVKKSVTTPSHRVKFLGFILDSTQQTISLSEEKVQKLQKMSQAYIRKPKCTKRSLAQVIGNLQACAPAIIPAPLHYRSLQLQLINIDAEDWDTRVHLNQASIRDLEWWTKNLHKWNGTPWKMQDPSLTVSTDASQTGWGAASSQGGEAQESWTMAEATAHINVLELKAIQLGLTALAGNVKNSTILIKSDNTTALAYVEKKGGTKCRDLTAKAIEIWEWALKRNNHLNTQHVPGKLNIRADTLSRWRDPSDYKLSTHLYNKLHGTWGPFSIDLFARKWNAQTKRFYSWKTHPEAEGTDAMTQRWPERGAYAFPPYCLIPKILREIQYQELEEIVLIAPIWKAMSWYTTLVDLSIANPIKLPTRYLIISDKEGNQTKAPHILAAWKLSSRNSKRLEYLKRLQKSWPTNKDQQHQRLTTLHGESGIAGIRKGTKIPFDLTYQQY